MIYQIYYLAADFKIPIKNWTGKLGPAEIVQKTISILLIVVNVAAVIALIVGGYQYITAAGNPEQSQKAKSTIWSAIIGLIVAWSAFAIISFIIQKI